MQPEDVLAAPASTLAHRRAALATESRSYLGLWVRGIVGLALLGLWLWTLIAGAAALGREIVGPWNGPIEWRDYRFALALRSLSSPLADGVFGGLSWIGEKVPMATGSAAVFFFLLWRRRFSSALCVALTMPGTAIMWKATALMVERQRPNWWLMHDPSDLGYPGGHVMNATVIAGICLAAVLPRLSERRLRGAVMFFWVLFVLGTGLSRIYVNAHFASDNLVGFAMGLFWVVVAVPLVGWAFPAVQNREPTRLSIPAGPP